MASTLWNGDDDDWNIIHAEWGIVIAMLSISVIVKRPEGEVAK